VGNEKNTFIIYKKEYENLVQIASCACSLKYNAQNYSSRLTTSLPPISVYTIQIHTHG